MHGIRWVAIMLVVPWLAGCGVLSTQRMVRVETPPGSGEILQGKVLLCYVDRTGAKPGVEHLSVDEDGEVRTVNIAGNEGRCQVR